MRRLALLLLAALAVAACGKKGPPVAPERRLPMPVADLSAEIRDGAVHLAWTNPARRADNTRLRGLGAARVYRFEDAGEGDPKPALLARGRIAGYTELMRLGPAPPAPGMPAPATPGARVEVTDDRAATYGRRYSYVVVTEDPEGRVSPPSARVSVTFIAPPAAPERLTAEAGENEVRLAWQPPARLADGSPLDGAILYEVLRAPDAGAEPQVITPAPIPDTELTDRGLDNDRTYHYAVRAVRRDAGTIARGQPSARVAATPVDTTPPAPPRDLVATPAGTTVRLAWSPSPDADVAGYVVYRAAAGGPFQRIGSTQAPSTVFADTGVAAGAWRYAVTAQDRAARPNESGRSNVAGVTLP